MPNENELNITFGNTNGTYATTTATYGTCTSDNTFVSSEWIKEYQAKRDENKAKWLEHCYGEWPIKLELRAVIPPETMGMRPTMAVFDELVFEVEEDEGAWTTP